MAPRPLLVASHRPPLTTNNKLLVFVNLVTFLLSIPLLVVGIWLSTHHHHTCWTFLHWPIIITSILMLIVSAIGFFGALRRLAFLLWIYLSFMLLVILLLLAFTIFAFVVTRGSKGHPVEGARFKEYRLNDYSPWLRNRANDLRIWNKIKRCLQDDHVCRAMDGEYQNVEEFYRGKLSYVESGCCKPPTACGFKFVNATNWVEPTDPKADVDCSRWSNKGDQLCYDCNSCRAGVIKTVNKDWGKAAKVMIVVLVLLVVLYVVAWVAFLNALTEKAMYTTAQSFRRR